MAGRGRRDGVDHVGYSEISGPSNCRGTTGLCISVCDRHPQGLGDYGKSVVLIMLGGMQQDDGEGLVWVWLVLFGAATGRERCCMDRVMSGANRTGCLDNSCSQG